MAVRNFSAAMETMRTFCICQETMETTIVVCGLPQAKGTLWVSSSFNSNGSYEFAHCETCDGPLLGHMETKCNHLDGVRYDGQIVKSFENWLK